MLASFCLFEALFGFFFRFSSSLSPLSSSSKALKNLKKNSSQLNQELNLNSL